jgi:hypothetical protein
MTKKILLPGGAGLVGALHGAYTLGLAVEHDGQLAQCEQYRSLIAIGRITP